MGQPRTADADVIVVGGGHNGAIAAAYLARAGIDTLLVEARSSIGGCASTVTDLGARFNICNCDHTMIRGMPIIDDLELEAHGLHYVEPEATVIAQFYDGSSPWVGFHEQERALASIEAFYPAEVAGYERYLADALPVARLALDIAKAPPNVPHFVHEAMTRNPLVANRLLSWSRKSIVDILRSYFTAEQMILPAIAAGPTVWGVPPDMAGTGLAALGYATRHLIKSGRPVGGSGALTDAVEASFLAAGGQVVYNACVATLLIEGGAVAGVRLEDGIELRAKTVVAACDPQRVQRLDRRGATEWGRTASGVASTANPRRL
ncbi:MAG: NAD(P)/FAD-dependent oxidoreductase [Acidimicrobiales bacterium]